MKTLKELQNELRTLVEDRDTERATYKFYSKVGKEAQEGETEIAKVIATLTKDEDSVEAKKLAEEFKFLDSGLKDLKVKLDSLKDNIKNDFVQKYFSAADEILTRVVEAADATITVSKSSETPKESFDKEAFFAELLTLMPHAAKIIVELKNKYTDISKTKNNPSVKVKTEALVSAYPGLIYFFKNVYDKLITRFDSKFNKLLERYNLKKDSNENI